MEKAFDTSALVEKLKAQGLHATEELVKVLVGETLTWVEESVLIHENPYVKFLAPVVATIKPLVLQQVDKIDGQVG